MPIETSVVDEVEAAATGFPSPDEFSRTLERELNVLNDFLNAVKVLHDGPISAADKAWFAAWVDRLEDLIAQANDWKTKLDKSEYNDLKDDLREEKKVLSGLIGLMQIVLTTGISDDETDFLIKAYRQDFRTTRKNIVNALNTQGL